MEIRDIVVEKATDNLVLVKYYNVTEGAYKSFFMTFDEFDKVGNDLLDMARYIFNREGK